MSDYSNFGYNYHSKIVNIDDTDYLIQGRVDDPITMFRPVDQVLECERDSVQTMPYFKELLGDESKNE